jgi:hypothetical protein
MAPVTARSLMSSPVRVSPDDTGTTRALAAFIADG